MLCHFSIFLVALNVLRHNSLMSHSPLNEHLWSQIQREISFIAQRSRGPGGQNVNRTNSSVQLRWSYLESVQFNEEQKTTIAEKLSSWITKEGILCIRSDIHRDQELNKKECLMRFQKLLEMSFFRPKPRRATKPTYSSKLKRKESKSRRSEIKKNRSEKW